MGSDPVVGIDVFSCECCVLSGRGPCIRLITHPEDSYRVQRVQHMSQNQVKVLQEKNKCKIHNFQFLLFFFLMFLMLLMLSYNGFFSPLHLSFFSNGPLGNNRWKLNSVCTFTRGGYFS